MIPIWIPAPHYDLDDLEVDEEPQLLIGEERERWEFWLGKVALI